jgi:hypothetical protein
MAHVGVWSNGENTHLAVSQCQKICAVRNPQERIRTNQAFVATLIAHIAGKLREA